MKATRAQSVDRAICEGVTRHLGEYDVHLGLALQFITQAMTVANPDQQAACVRIALENLVRGHHIPAQRRGEAA